jgi:plastocyanin
MGLSALLACSGGGGDGGGTTGPAVFTTLDVQPATVNVAVNGTQALTATAKDQNGATMSGLTVAYQSSDQTKATVTQAGVVTGVAAGTATITATGTVGTVTKTKTVNVTVSAPGQAASVTATSGNLFDPQSVTIVPGGTVTWTFQAQHNVSFTTAGAPANIGTMTSGSDSRTFPTAGTYNYFCTIHGSSMSGTVRVQ